MCDCSQRSKGHRRGRKGLLMRMFYMYIRTYVCVCVHAHD